MNSSSSLLEVQPSSNLEFLLESGTSMLELKNKTNEPVTFQVECNNKKKYSIQPNEGVIQPGSTKSITVTVKMVGQDEVSKVWRGKDKFRVKSKIVPHLFDEKAGRITEVTMLGVVCVLANPPTPIPKEPEEESPPSSSLSEHVKQPSETRFQVSKPSEERASALEEKDSECTRKEEEPNASSYVFSSLWVSIFVVLGALICYFIAKKASSL